MAFDINKLVLTSPHGVPSAPNTYVYTTTDALADVNTAAYFNDASRILKVNDVIMGVTSTGTTPVHAFYIVNSVVVDGAVDVSDGLVITATDSD